MTTLIFSMIILFGGRLLPTWIYINSLQLVVYAPLVAISMPSNLHYFLVNYLHLMRLNFGEVDTFFSINYEQVQDIRPNEHDNESYLSPLLLMCGYRRPLSNNLIIIGGLLLFFVSGLAIYHCIVKSCKGRKNGRLMPKISNLSLRFAYEFFFEICLSMVILAAIMPENKTILWLPVILTFAAIGALVVFLISRFFTGGPFVPKSFESGSLFSSYWSTRPLN